MCLLDMGGEYHRYASDITCSFPANGKFTSQQKWIYQAVLDAQKAVFNAMKPGVSWVEMHKLAARTISKHLIEQGLLYGTVEEIEKNEVMYRFQPHGLGHLIGMDVHDPGGYPKGGIPRPDNDLCRRLRTARILQAGMFITVEPGLYFNKTLLKEAFADPELAKFFNREVIEKPEFWDFGGVRLEDDVLVTDYGCRNLTCCPREVEDVENVMAGTLLWNSEPTDYHNVEK